MAHLATASPVLIGRNESGARPPRVLLGNPSVPREKAFPSSHSASVRGDAVGAPHWERLPQGGAASRLRPGRSCRSSCARPQPRPGPSPEEDTEVAGPRSALGQVSSTPVPHLPPRGRLVAGRRLDRNAPRKAQRRWVAAGHTVEAGQGRREDSQPVADRVPVPELEFASDPWAPTPRACPQGGACEPPHRMGFCPSRAVCALGAPPPPTASGQLHP